MKFKGIVSSIWGHWMGRAKHYALMDQKVELGRLKRIWMGEVPSGGIQMKSLWKIFSNQDLRDQLQRQNLRGRHLTGKRAWMWNQTWFDCLVCDHHSFFNCKVKIDPQVDDQKRRRRDWSKSGRKEEVQNGSRYDTAKVGKQVHQAAKDTRSQGVTFIWLCQDGFPRSGGTSNLLGMCFQEKLEKGQGKQVREEKEVDQGCNFRQSSRLSLLLRGALECKWHLESSSHLKARELGFPAPTSHHWL